MRRHFKRNFLILAFLCFSHSALAEAGSAPLLRIIQPKR
jgi:hypothetical protein